MSQTQWSAVEHYLNEYYVPHDAVLEAVLQASEAAGLPAINVAPSQGKLLALLSQTVQARRILEIGTLGAYSTIWMARGLPADGELVTLEYDPHHVEVAQANLERAGVADRVQIRVGQALTSLQALRDEGQRFDLVFIDADKANIVAYFQQSLALTRPGGLIICDNVVRNGAVTDPNSTDVNVQGVRSLHEAIAAEPRVMAAAFQTVGTKGYDGMTLVLVLA